MSKKSSWWSDKHRKYKHRDKQAGLVYDLTLEQAKALMSLPCFYCCQPEARGLDRISNDLGHELKNLVPCCGTCNLMLASTPWSAKLEMRESLRSIKEKNLLGDWKPPYLSQTKSAAKIVGSAIALSHIKSTEKNEAIIDRSIDVLMDAVEEFQEETEEESSEENNNNEEDCKLRKITINQDELKTFYENNKLSDYDSVTVLDSNKNPRMWILRQVKYLDEEF